MIGSFSVLPAAIPLPSDASAAWPPFPESVIGLTIKWRILIGRWVKKTGNFEPVLHLNCSFSTKYLAHINDKIKDIGLLYDAL